MNGISRRQWKKLYDYAMRDGYIYSRVYPGSGYGPFLTDLQNKLKNGELSLDEAYDRVGEFRPLPYKLSSSDDEDKQ